MSREDHRGGYRSGDNWIVSDRSGRKVRASEARKEWNGSVVHKDEWDSRHPQEFVRGVRDDQRPSLVRPRAIDTFVGPLKTEVTASHAAGETLISVLSSTRFGLGDRIHVMLDSGDAHQAVVQSVPDAAHLLLLSGLPGSTSTGKAVINYSAIAEADLG